MGVAAVGAKQVVACVAAGEAAKHKLRGLAAAVAGAWYVRGSGKGGAGECVVSGG